MSGYHYFSISQITAKPIYITGVSKYRPDNIMELIPYSISQYSLETYLGTITTRSRIIYWIVIGLIISGIAVLPFVYVDVSVQARGYFQSDIEKQIVYTPFQGKIVYISIHNGNRVSKGDTLLIIDSESVRAQRTAILQQINENNSSIRDLGKLTSLTSSEDVSVISGIKTQRYQAELANLRNQYYIQLQVYQKKKSEHERNKLLYEQKILTEVEYENSLFALNSEKDNLSQILIYQASLWHSDLTMRKNESVTLLAELEKCGEQLNNRIVQAPTDGEIIQSSDIQVGSIISQGQKIAEISPDGDLLATCFVKPADIGLVHEHQQVRIQVDAFNYNEWGMIEGDIIDISDDMIVEDGSNAYFRIKCRPKQTYLSLKNGHRAYIKKGMSVNTRIVIIRRTLYNLLFDKADKWFNPYNFKPE